MIEILRLDDVSVNNGGPSALKRLNLCAYEGEVHGITGDFGINHSELLRLLSLGLEWTGGRVYFNSRETRRLAPAEARARGIFSISEDGNLFPGLSVIENIYILGRRRFGWRLRKKEISPLSRQYFDFFGLDIDLNGPLDTLTLLERCSVAIVGSLISGARLIVFDEITSSLGEQDGITFKKILSCLTYMGVTVICIVNRIDELVFFTDRATLVKNGETVRVIAREDYSYDNILAMLIV